MGRVEPTYDAEAVKAKRQRRIARTRIAAAVASGVTFGAAVAGFALHDNDQSSASNSSTTATTTLDQGNGNTFGTNDDNGFGSQPIARTPSLRSDTGTRGS